MEADERLLKAKRHCDLALSYLVEGEQRKAVGCIDFIESYVEAAKWILINQIKDEEGKF